MTDVEAFRNPELCTRSNGAITASFGEGTGLQDIAHALMPDHVHVLGSGERPDSDFLKWLESVASAFRLLGAAQHTGEYLWQEGYWDYTLRDAESVRSIASYIVLNPVVAGLVQAAEDYPFSGSQRFSIAELAAGPPSNPTVRRLMTLWLGDG